MTAKRGPGAVVVSKHHQPRHVATRREDCSMGLPHLHVVLCVAVLLLPAALATNFTASTTTNLVISRERGPLWNRLDSRIGQSASPDPIDASMWSQMCCPAGIPLFLCAQVCPAQQVKCDGQCKVSRLGKAVMCRQSSRAIKPTYSACTRSVLLLESLLPLSWSTHSDASWRPRGFVPALPFLSISFQPGVPPARCNTRHTDPLTCWL